MHLGIKVSSTKVTNEAKTYMHTPHKLPEVRGGFKMLLTIVTDNTDDLLHVNLKTVAPRGSNYQKKTVDPRNLK